ncbi:MAG: DUF2804 domain-containing protein [Bacilli bacterium]|nr:DUF2804 domain-containing protein [Bacilli bacterium]
MEQNLLHQGKLLDENGNLTESGYHYRLVKEYSRDDIKASKMRIKEWDYYYIGNNKKGFSFTIADNSYLDLCSITMLDFEKKTYFENSRMHFFSNGKRNLPSSSEEGITDYEDKRVNLTFSSFGNKRYIRGEFKKYVNNMDLEVNLELSRTNDSSMVIATPFKKKKHFYYNQKINCLRASGTVRLGKEKFQIDDSFLGVLDWGRGVWTYKNTWYWSSLQSYVGNDIIGFNLGYGFGDTSKATENMLFVNNDIYKIQNVVFNIPKDEKGRDDYLKPWTITSDDSIIDLKFKPIINRHSDSNILIIRSNQNQVFGLFSGYVKAGDKIIRLEDKLGFAEKVYNRW